MAMNRRTFLKAGLSGLAYFTAEATTPNWIIRSAQALPASGAASDRILVILQQAGGNDGLNTVIPRTDPLYYDAATRPTIRIPSGAEINLDGLNGFHPRLSNLADWYQDGKVAILQSVGYLNPNLSHFTSTDYYELGSAPGEVFPTKGWAARYYDNACAGVENPYPLFMTAAGLSQVPDALAGANGYTPPAVLSPLFYQLSANQDSTLRLPAIAALNSIPTIDPNIDFLQRSSNIAQASIADIAAASAMPDLAPPGSYPAGSLGSGLRLVSQIIRAGFGTRIFYVSQGGYDTHSNQIQPGNPLIAGDHPRLLGEFDQALNAFLVEMQMSENLDRVLVMTFSEFGRRVQENASFGTDHGAANCAFVLGGPVRGGVYGGQPNLGDLIKGNLKHHVDFRSVYSRVIESWLGSDAVPVFGQGTYDSIIQTDYPNIDFVEQPNAVPAAHWTRY